MHSYLRTVGFSKVKSRKEMQEIIQDVINTYDEKIAVENHPDGVFVQYSKNYGWMIFYRNFFIVSTHHIPDNFLHFLA